LILIDRLWKAPEMLRDLKSVGSQPGDVYSFAIILHELLFHQGPYAIDCGKNSAKNIVNLVIASGQRKTPYRPPIEVTICQLCRIYSVYRFCYKLLNSLLHFI